MVKGNDIIYQIFVRNYSKEGTFQAVQQDLPRLKELGVDIIYLMPIHEIGIKNRKGTWGSPYAIKDYYSISKDLGTKDDFISLITTTHKMGMKIIMDMVFNHTSPDSVILEKHPEYYFYRNGKLGNRVGDWSDIIDLDTNREDTQTYLLDVLKYWVSLGVDGFRFDVASMISLDFFKRARNELGKDVIFFAESIDYDFVNYLKSLGYSSTPDIDMYPTFDLLYNYSWFRPFERYLKNEMSYENLKEIINEDYKYIGNKGLRVICFENHDTERIASYVDENKLKEIVLDLTKYKGPLFIYMGQEYGVKHRPNLFEKDPVNWEPNNKVLEIYKEAIKIKKSQ